MRVVGEETYCPLLLQGLPCQISSVIVGPFYFTLQIEEQQTTTLERDEIVSFSESNGVKKKEFLERNE